MEDFFGYAESGSIRDKSTSFNSLATFSAYFERSDEFKRAINVYLANSSIAAQLISDRIVRLFEVRSEGSYLHPYDTAIAVYLLLLYKVDTKKSLDMLGTLRGKDLSNYWWTRHLLGILSKTNISETTHNVSWNITTHQQLDTGIVPSGLNSISNSETNNVIGVTNHA
jgi:hypothetical protein